VLDAGDDQSAARLQDQRPGLPIDAGRGRREGPSLLAERQVRRAIRVDPEQQVPVNILTRHAGDAPNVLTGIGGLALDSDAIASSAAHAPARNDNFIGLIRRCDREEMNNLRQMPARRICACDFGEWWAVSDSNTRPTD